MKRAIAIAKAKAGKQSGNGTYKTGEPGHLDLEVSKIGLGTMLITGLLFGLFGVLFVLGGLLASGNPLDMIRGWLGAAFGG